MQDLSNKLTPSIIFPVLLITLMALSGCDNMKKEIKQMSMGNRLHKKETIGMCTQQIIYSEDVKKYVDIIEKIIKPLTPNIQNNGESLGIVKKPLHAIFILNENDFNLLTEKLKPMKQDVALTIQDYKKVSGLGKNAIEQLLLSKPIESLETAFGFWFPAPSSFIFKNFEIMQGECYIAICPTSIARYSEKMKDQINENIENIKLSMFRI